MSLAHIFLLHFYRCLFIHMVAVGLRQHASAAQLKIEVPSCASKQIRMIQYCVGSVWLIWQDICLSQSVSHTESGKLITAITVLSVVTTKRCSMCVCMVTTCLWFQKHQHLSSSTQAKKKDTLARKERKNWFYSKDDAINGKCLVPSKKPAKHTDTVNRGKKCWTSKRLDGKVGKWVSE